MPFGLTRFTQPTLPLQNEFRCEYEEIKLDYNPVTGRYQFKAKNWYDFSVFQFYKYQTDLYTGANPDLGFTQVYDHGKCLALDDYFDQCRTDFTQKF